jgi:hypothetical protein
MSEMAWFHQAARKRRQPIGSSLYCDHTPPGGIMPRRLPRRIYDRRFTNNPRAKRKPRFGCCLP